MLPFENLLTEIFRKLNNCNDDDDDDDDDDNIKFNLSPGYTASDKSILSLKKMINHEQNI